MVDLQQLLLGWGPTSNGLGVLGLSADWPIIEGEPWLPDHMRRFLPPGSDAEVMRGATPPCGLTFVTTPYGTLLSMKTYLGRVSRPGTFVAHALLDPTRRLGPVDAFGAVRDGVLLMREEEPTPGDLPVVRRNLVRIDPAPDLQPRDLLQLLIGCVAAGRSLVMHTSERSIGMDVLESLVTALPAAVSRSMWWSGFVSDPLEIPFTGPGVGLATRPFSVLPEEPLPAPAPVIVDLDHGSPTVDGRSAALARVYLDDPDAFAHVGSVEEFVDQLEARVLDPTAPVDDRVLDLLSQESGPQVFARLVGGGRGMMRLDEIAASGRRLPFGKLWSAVPELPDPMYDWFGPVRAEAAQQENAQRVITATMDFRNLTRLVARPLSREVGRFRPVIADRKLASAVANLTGAQHTAAAASYEWRVLPEDWGPMVSGLVSAWLQGYQAAPHGLGEFAHTDAAAFRAGMGEAISDALARGMQADQVRAALVGWRDLPALDWLEHLLAIPEAPSGTALAVLGECDRGDIRQVLRRDWPRLAAQAGIPEAVAGELRPRGLGW